MYVRLADSQFLVWGWDLCMVTYQASVHPLAVGWANLFNSVPVDRASREGCFFSLFSSNPIKYSTRS